MQRIMNNGREYPDTFDADRHGFVLLTVVCCIAELKEVYHGR